jgi:hypothetical protein
MGETVSRKSGGVTAGLSRSPFERTLQGYEATNKLALNAGWDLEMLSLEIGELGEARFDLSPHRL